MDTSNPRTFTMTLRLPQPCGCMAELSATVEIPGASACGCYGMRPDGMVLLIGRLGGQIMEDYATRIQQKVPWPCAGGLHDWTVCPEDNGGRRAPFPPGSATLEA